MCVYVIIVAYSRSKVNRKGKKENPEGVELMGFCAGICSARQGFRRGSGEGRRKREVRLWRIYARLPLTSELGLTAGRSRSRENNTQLFSNTLAPLRYALYGSMQHTDKVGILPGEQIKLTLVQSVTIAANYTASGNTPFCDSESHRGALESSRT